MLKLFTVVVVSLAGIGYLLLRSRAPAALENSGSAITVEATYPGANTEIVADSVAAPIEEQVKGVEKMIGMTSRCDNDGRYVLTVTFERGTDLELALARVQKRVLQAEPALPAPVQQLGISTKKKSPGVLMFLHVLSPDDRYDRLYLSNYVRIHIKDELDRVPGVGSVMVFGERVPVVRILIDVEKLKARDIKPDLVKETLESETTLGLKQLESLPGGKGFQASGITQRRLTDPQEQFGDVILRTDDKGNTIRLRDVAKVELAARDTRAQARLDGKPAVILDIELGPTARPKEVTAAIRERLSQLRVHLPKGVEIDVAFDFTPNLDDPKLPATSEYLRLDLTLAAGDSIERRLKVVEQCQKLLREIEGVENVLGLCGAPFAPLSNQALLLVRLAPAEKRKASREQLMQAIRTRLGRDLGSSASVRLCDLWDRGRYPGWNYPVDLAVVGPKADEVRKFGQKLAERLRQTDKLTDLAISPGAMLVAQLYLDIDHDRVKSLGVQMDDLFDALQAYVGADSLSDPSMFARKWQMQVVGDKVLSKKIDDLKVRNIDGKMVPVASMITARELTGPLIIERRDGQPMAGITANPAPGVSLAEARSLCQKTAEEVRKDLSLSDDYRLSWTQALPLLK